MFEQAFIEKLAAAVAVALRIEKAKAPERWPEIMSMETAALYIDRTSEAVRHLLSAGEIPTCKYDRRVHVRRVDLDRWAERHTG